MIFISPGYIVQRFSMQKKALQMQVQHKKQHALMFPDTLG